MAGKLIPTIRPDQIAAERFRAMLLSEPFRVLMERLRAEWERARDTCISGDDELAIRRAQGAAAAWRTAIAMPDQIYAELKSGLRKSR